MEHHAPRIPPQSVSKASVWRLVVTGSLVPTSVSTNAASVEEMDLLARKFLDQWNVLCKSTTCTWMLPAWVLQHTSSDSVTDHCLFLHFRPGYQDIVTIPAGATHLDVKQRSLGGRRHDNSYLAVRRQDGTYLLNGDYKLMTLETDISLKGALLRYSGSSATLERLRSFAPLPEALTIQVLSVGDSPRPRVKYSYFAPRPIGSNRPSINAISEAGDAEWALREWGPCSQTCGGGIQKRDVLCLDAYGHQSKDCPEELRPASSQSCALQACPSWLQGEWSDCSKACGRGYRKRQLRCIGHDGRILPNESCNAKNQPRPRLELCNLTPCWNWTLRLATTSNGCKLVLWIQRALYDRDCNQTSFTHPTLGTGHKAGTQCTCLDSCDGGEEYEHLCCFGCWCHAC